jgi:hypothetical protein
MIAIIIYRTVGLYVQVQSIKITKHAGHRVTKLAGRSTFTDDLRPLFTLKAEASCH